MRHDYNWPVRKLRAMEMVLCVDTRRSEAIDLLPFILHVLSNPEKCIPEIFGMKAIILV